MFLIGLVLNGSILTFAQSVNFYTVKIGNQVWMQENLNVDKFRNGEPIPYAKNSSEWAEAMRENKPAWCYYNDYTDNAVTCGKLYNWYAVNDPRGLAPVGWHIPTEEEFKTLIENAGNIRAGDNLKTIDYWMPIDYNTVSRTTNSTGFSGMPCGLRSEIDATSRSISAIGGWWSSTKTPLYGWETGYRAKEKAVAFILKYNDSRASTGNYDAAMGLNVRCVKD